MWLICHAVTMSLKTHIDETSSIVGQLGARQIFPMTCLIALQTLVGEERTFWVCGWSDGCIKLCSDRTRGSSVVWLRREELTPANSLFLLQIFSATCCNTSRCKNLYIFDHRRFLSRSEFTMILPFDHQRRAYTARKGQCWISVDDEIQGVRENGGIFRRLFAK